jgi:subtilase family serine protease
MLDIQWAHAIAPEAKIVLVEAQSNHGGDLIFAVDRAIDTLNRSKGRGGVISMSFGFPFAFEDQQAFETTFSTERARNVSFIAASGDLGGVTSGAPVGPPSVTIVGGTKLYLDPFGNRVTGFVNEDAIEDVNYGLVPPPNLLDLLDNWDHDIDCFPPADINDDSPIDEQFGISGGEGAWWDGSGGPSPIFNAPLWQQNRLGPLLVDLDGDGIPNRGTPDVSWNAHPATGVSVFNTFGSGGFSGWATVGGTSAGAPQFAGMIALVNQLRAADNRAPVGNSLNERIYRLGGRGPDAYFNDIEVHGSGLLDFDVACDASPGTGRQDGAFVFPANIGWDYATGWGSPNARSLIPALAQRDRKIKHFRNAQTVRFTGRISQRIFQGATGGIPAGPESLSLALFKGTTTVSGLNTLVMPAFRMNHLQTVSGTGGFGGGVGGGGGGGQPPRTTTVTVDIIGMDDVDGQPNPPAYDLVRGVPLAPGSPIFLWRDGNHITGKAFWIITVLGPDGDLDAAEFFHFPIEFRGKVVKNEIHGEFFAIDADQHSTPMRGVFNERGFPVVQGRFDSERE